jgi:hypothetical protein
MKMCYQCQTHDENDLSDAIQVYHEMINFIIKYFRYTLYVFYVNDVHVLCCLKSFLTESTAVIGR